MKLKAIDKVKTKDEARQIGIDFQAWQSTRSLSYGKLVHYRYYLAKLAKKFNLVGEFNENGII